MEKNKYRKKVRQRKKENGKNSLSITVEMRTIETPNAPYIKK